VIVGVCVRGVVGDAEGDRVLRIEDEAVRLAVELLVGGGDTDGLRVENLVGVPRLLGVCVLDGVCVRVDVGVEAKRLKVGKGDLEWVGDAVELLECEELFVGLRVLAELLEMDADPV